MNPEHTVELDLATQEQILDLYVFASNTSKERLRRLLLASSKQKMHDCISVDITVSGYRELIALYVFARHYKRDLECLVYRWLRDDIRTQEGWNVEYYNKLREISDGLSSYYYRLHSRGRHICRA